MAKVSASILACDHTKIGEQVLEAEKAGADIVHIDVMDGVMWRMLLLDHSL